jgi:hypothetical protein
VAGVCEEIDHEGAGEILVPDRMRGGHDRAGKLCVDAGDEAGVGDEDPELSGEGGLHLRSRCLKIGNKFRRVGSLVECREVTDV